MALVWTQLSRTVDRSLDATPRQPVMDYWHRYSVFDMCRRSVTGTTRIYMGNSVQQGNLPTPSTPAATSHYWIETTMGSGLLLLSFFSYFTFSATENKGICRPATHRNDDRPLFPDAPQNRSTDV